jgi:hypothetical protein
MEAGFWSVTIAGSHTSPAHRESRKNARRRMNQVSFPRVTFMPPVMIGISFASL